MRAVTDSALTSREPVDCGQGVDPDVEHFALGLREGKVGVALLLLTDDILWRSSGRSLGEQLLAVDGAQSAEFATVYGVFGPLDPPGVDGTVHLVYDPGFVHRLDDGVGGLDASAQGLVEVDVLARLGTLDGDDAPPLDAGRTC